MSSSIINVIPNMGKIGSIEGLSPQLEKVSLNNDWSGVHVL
jgi:hypothetical protein